MTDTSKLDALVNELLKVRWREGGYVEADYVEVYPQDWKNIISICRPYYANQALAYLKDIDAAQCSGEVWDAICNAVEMLE